MNDISEGGVCVYGVRAQCARTPEHVAIWSEGRTLLYRELGARASALARQLRERGVGPDVVVAICLPRSPEMVIAVLAVLEAGGCYLPLDAAYPEDRLAFMLEDARAAVLLTNPELQKALPATVSEVIHVEDAPAPTDVDPLPLVSRPEHLAYLIYTSGSTGRPKGVAMPHGPLAHLISWQLGASAQPAARTLQFSPLSFDVHFQEILSTLSAGGTLVLINEELRLDAGKLLDFLEAQRIERLFLPFVALQGLCEIADARGKSPSQLREVITAGEQLQVTPALVRFFQRLPEATLHNHYGPSETHVVTAYTLQRPPDTWPALPPIGTALPSARLYLLDEQRRPVPEGSEGELFIGGECLARGYLNRPELTAERFLSDPFRGGDARMYRTGDLARVDPEGQVQFLGRIDGQVKVRGYRIELGEVEVAVSQHPSVGQAVVIVREDAPGDKQLVGYVQLTRPLEQAAQTLRAHLASKLPDYMIPSAFVEVEAFPRTPSGKIDRRALPAPGRERPTLAQPYVAPESELEQALTAIWGELLRIDRVGVDDGFFDLGGNSLRALQMVAALKKARGLDVPVLQVFQTPTIRGLAAALSDGGQPDAIRRLRERAAREADHSGDRVAIIGMAGRFPGAADVSTLWKNLCAGVESIRFFGPEELDPDLPPGLLRDPAYVRARGVIDGADRFDAAFFGISPREAAVMDPQQRIFLELSWAALEDAGYVPERVRGLVGVWAGTHNNSYFPNNVATRPDAIAHIGDFQAMVANEKDYVATRVAHRLDLTGPAVSVHTACSTSLVAVAQAFHALRTGQCDVAIAGGAAVTVPQASGYLYQEGGMLSGDGHCRTFDEKAQGTIFSDGAGAVVLKRLSDAVRDGDHVYAVILGVGVNNDGGAKASFSAPSVDGQAAAIAMAQAQAGVSPRSISYVEAHGTATPLGDPIEVEALTRAFRLGTEDRNFCRIGSIKSNFGHLTAAAGVAGLIKASLALEHEQLPPSLHFERPNPSIPFDQSPFVVNAALTPWSRSEAPRRAGVSAFGVGGTNAHVVLEEAPPVPASGPSAPRHLVAISARTPGALDEATRNLADHLKSHPELPLSEVAYTLQVGRRAFPHRRFVVAGDTAEAAALLASGDTGRIVTRQAAARPPPVAFLFPGQGSQSVRMGEALYRSEPVFRAVVDQCAAILQPRLGRDLRELLYPSEGGEEAAAAALRETWITQPALFTIEYALAQLWLGWGVRPSAMAGHSVGEFVAACLAGVFSLEDALMLVAERGRLMQSMPPGTMLSVRLPAQKVEERLSGNLGVASVNGPSLCVVAGPTDEVEALSRMLDAEGVAFRALVTSHAFHSPMMDPAIEPFRRIVDGVKLSPPSLPIISTVTGLPLTAAQATDPAYWARHLREPVRFADAVRELWKEPARVMLEVGPRATLATLARQQIQDRARQLAASSLSEGATGDAEWTALLTAAGQLFCAGVPLDWERFHASEKRRRVSLPTYPFERQRHWLERTVTALHTSPAPTPAMPTTTPSRLPRLTSELKDAFAETSGLDLDQADASTSFLELGFDSLMLTQIALGVSRKYGQKITFRQLMEDHSSFDLLARHLDGLLPPEAAPAPATAPAVSAPVVQPAVAPGAAPTPLPAPAMALQPAFAAMPVAPVGAVATGVQALIEQQLRIMSQQLAVLGAAPVQVLAAPAPVTVSQPTSPPVIAAAPDLVATASSAIAAAPAASGEEEASQGPVRYDVKKAFGAIARIHTQTDSGLTPRQQARLDAFIRRYNARTAGSKAAAEASRERLADPRVVTGFRPLVKELVYPILVNRSRGARLWDVDGNEYVDALNGFGSNFFGYAPDFVREAVHRQVDEGYELGPQTPLANKAAALFCELTGLDRAAFCNTGSEAVMGAMRMARTVTGRNTIAIFSGSYHGIFDEVIVRGTKKLKAVPAAPGILPEGLQNIIVLDYGTPESLEILKARADELAAVMVEPVQSRRPDFQPREFLHAVREITQASGSALIFDEVITGFRSHPGGAQAIFGVRADIATYGKVVGGGMPIGVIAGCKRFMDALDGGEWRFGDNSVPTVGVTYFAGTFVRHPLAMAAAVAVLEHMKARGPALQQEVTARTERLASTLNAHFASVGAPLKIKHFASLWKAMWTEDQPHGDLVFYMLRDRGVHIYDGFPCFLTTAHGDAEVDFIIKAFKESVAELQEAGFLPEPPRKETPSNAFDANRPPVPGARLGRDPHGNPAWYVPNPEAPGKFIKLEG